MQKFIATILCLSLLILSCGGEGGDNPPLTSLDQDKDGYTVAAGDCNDLDASINPGVADLCDGIDNDCDGAVDQDCAPVVINEISYDDPTDDALTAFIELYSPLYGDLAGYSLVALNGADSSPYATIFLTGTIEADGYYLITHIGAEAGLYDIADQHNASADLQNGPDSLVLYYDYGGPNEQIVDMVGYGATVNFFETAPAPDAASGSSLGRYPNGQDTDDNWSDFIEMQLTPGSENAIGCASDAACDDGLDCTTDTCDFALGTCSNTIDAGFCLIAGSCYANGNGDGCNLCDATNPTAWTPKANGTPCDDANACTENDTCSDGICSGGSLVICDDSNPCTDDACDAITGCYETQVANSTPCDDGDLYSVNDICTDGTCQGTPIDCDDDNPCTIDTLNPSTGCQYSDIANGTPCDDADAFTEFDSCTDGTCQGTPIDCDDLNPCTIDTLDPSTGCQYTDVTNGTPCDDGDAYTENDLCTDGACQGAPVDCDDLNPCTDDSYDPALGCVNTNANNTVCDDGDALTENDICTDGACQGTPIDCDDLNPCTIDSLDPATGCVYTVDTGALCDDGDACTENDTCASNGICQGTQKACDDSIGCTEDSCAAGICQFTPRDYNCFDGDPGTTDTCSPVDDCVFTPITPGTCGGITNIPCPVGFVCGCDSIGCSPTVMGECIPENSYCFDVYIPVCGCDGITYSNDCVRMVEGVAKAHDGTCDPIIEGSP